MSEGSQAEGGLDRLPLAEMESGILRPPERLEPARSIFFLAGPVSGAPEWHGEAEQLLQELAPEFIIANPNTDNRPEGSPKVPYDLRTEWEEYHLAMAGEHGYIVFWVPAPAAARAVEGYAKTTMFELGEWKQRHVDHGAQLVVGIEPGAPNESYLRQRFAKECPGVAIRETLAETCAEAVARLSAELRRLD
jgi:hypothetical protein